MPSLSAWLQGAALLFPMVHPVVRHGGGTVWVLLVLGGGGLWLRARRRGEALPLLPAGEVRWLLLALLAIPLAQWLSLVNADEWRHVGPKLEKGLQVLLFPLAYLLVRHARADLGRWFLWGCVVAAPLMLVVGMWQMLHGAQWAHGAYYRILYGDLALYFLVIMVAADLMWLRGRSRWLLWGGMACALVAVLLSGTRGAWLAGLVFLPWALWCYRRVLRPRQWLVLGMASVVGVALLVTVPSPIQQRLNTGLQELENLGEGVGSWGTRYQLWRLSVALWREHPWLGTGVGDLPQEIRRAAEAGEYHAGIHYDHAHSLYFDALATLGTVGFLALMAGFFLLPTWFFLRHWRRARGDPYRRFLALAGLVGVAAFALFGLTEAWFSRMHFTRAYLFHLLVFVSALSIAEEGRVGESA